MYVLLGEGKQINSFFTTSPDFFILGYKCITINEVNKNIKYFILLISV